MERQTISSSDIKSIGWEKVIGLGPGIGNLEIKFAATGVYRYYAVPERVFEQFSLTPSPGKFFLMEIKGKYAWEKILDQNQLDTPEQSPAK